MNSKKQGCYIDESLTRCGPISYSNDDLALTEAINTSRNMAALERQIELYAKEIESNKKSTRVANCIAIISALISLGSLITTIIFAV